MRGERTPRAPASSFGGSFAEWFSLFAFSLPFGRVERASPPESLGRVGVLMLGMK